MRHPALVVAATLIVAAVSAARAGTNIDLSPGINSNYTFPDGSAGFALQGLLPAVQNSTFNPGVLVGFNPQPDPPGTPPTFLSLTDPERPTLNNASPRAGYAFVMSFINLFPPDPCDTTIPMPNADGITGFHCDGSLGGAPFNVDVALQFSGPGGVASWVAFNPQPDPPGVPVGYDLSFAGLDGSVSFAISVNDQPLDFQMVPEPATLVLLGGGLVGLATVRRRRRG